MCCNDVGEQYRPRFSIVYIHKWDIIHDVNGKLFMPERKYEWMKQKYENNMLGPYKCSLEATSDHHGPSVYHTPSIDSCE